MAAITFTRNAVGNLSGVKAVAGLNDNWIQFNGQSDALSAEIVITNNDTAEEKTFVISPDGSATPQFYFNLKEAVRSFFPTAIDDFDYSGDVTDPVKLWQDLTIDITITHSVSANDTGSISAYFLRSKRQPPESIFITTNERLTKKAVLFEGYPLSVSKIEEPNGIAINDSYLYSAQETQGWGIFFKPDGTKMYLAGNNSGEVLEFALSTPWDITTATYTDALDTDVEFGEIEPRGIFIDSTGTYIIIVGNDATTIYIGEMSVEFDVSTTQSLTSFNVLAQESTPRAIHYKPDGTKAYIIGAQNKIFEYDMSGFDDNTPTFVDEFNYSAIDNDVKGLFAKSDGTKFYLVGSQNNAIYELELSTAWDITTATLVNTIPIGAQSTDPSGIYVKADEAKIYINDVVDARVYEMDVEIMPNLTRYTIDSGNKALLIDEERDECGVYLKWLNWQGGYSYWLFERIYPETHQTRSEGEYLNNAIDEPNFPTFEIGKELRISRQLKGTANDRATIELFQSLVRSNEVYLFTGEKGDAADETTWITVTMRDGSFKFTNKRDAMEMSFTIDLPTV